MDKIGDRKSFEVGGHLPLWRGWKSRMTTQNRKMVYILMVSKSSKKYEYIWYLTSSEMTCWMLLNIGIQSIFSALRTASMHGDLYVELLLLKKGRENVSYQTRTLWWKTWDPLEVIVRSNSNHSWVSKTICPFS